MHHKIYLVATLVATLIVLLVACVTPESTVDSKVDVTDAADQRKSRVDSAQQVIVSDTMKKGLFTVQDTSKTKFSSRKK